MSSDPGIWVAGILTLFAYSFLYKDNKIYQATEHLYVGLGAGYTLTQGYNNVVGSGVEPLMEGNLWFIIPMILGLMLFGRFSPGTRWMSYYPMGVIVAIGATLALRGAIPANIIEQLQATMVPINSINRALVVFGTLATLTFFFFTLGAMTNRNSLLFKFSLLGRWVLMVAFGAAFGNAVMGRTSLLIARIQFVLGDWLGMIGP
ncbi:MAG: hypothetical protein ACLFS8_04410 [Clostridia bacterium]